MTARSLGFVVATMIIGSLTISYIGLNRMEAMNFAIKRLVTGNVARTVLVKDLRHDIDLQALDQRNIILEQTDEGMVVIKKRIEERHEGIMNIMKEFEGNTNEIGQREITEVRASYLKWWAVNPEIISHALKLENQKAFEVAKAKAAPLRGVLSEQLGRMVDRQQGVMSDESKNAYEEYTQARTMVLTFSVISIVVGVAISLMVLVALGRAINQIISDLSGSSDQMSAASQQIASSSEQLSEASTEQAASLEETVSTLEELTSMVKVNTDQAKEAARISEQTRNIADKGEQEIRGLVTAMEEISKDSKKIEEIISVIDNIAFQTNLLALNAAVEAARAGEQGKGFAVVAEAVRNLAQRSAAAAKDITNLIKGSVEKIERGSQQAGQSGQVLVEIVSAVKKVSEINAEIAMASEQQSSSILQIGKAMNQLDQVTQVNAASSEEAAGSAQELSAQAGQLAQVVTLLAATIHGGGTASLVVPSKMVSFTNAKVIPMKSKVENFRESGLKKVGTTEGF